jgi:hypothetical protein
VVGGYKEREKEDEHGGILHTYENGKMKLFQEWDEGDKGKMMEGVHSTMIYGKHFCDCHSAPQVQQ